MKMRLLIFLAVLGISFGEFDEIIGGEIKSAKDGQQRGVEPESCSRQDQIVLPNPCATLL